MMLPQPPYGPGASSQYPPCPHTPVGSNNNEKSETSKILFMAIFFW